jgi:uncharacterized damage-inducible protein DinB
MTADDLRLLLDYHYWARDRVLDASDALTQEQLTRDLGNSFRSVRDTLAHLHGSEWIWLSRWQGTSPTTGLPPDRFENVAAVRAGWSEIEGQVRTFASALTDETVDQFMDYRLLNGTAGRSRVWHMVQHMVNHASYHRGQVTTMLRQLGAAPPQSMDLITFYRDRGA